jgi:TIR domain
MARPQSPIVGCSRDLPQYDGKPAQAYGSRDNSCGYLWRHDVKAVLAMAHDVFISHSHEDKPVADAACAALEARGIRCWIAPRDIDPGQDWAASIVAAIRGAQIMLLVFSRHANQSSQVKREVERAASSGKAILPLRIDDVLPEEALEYYLSTPHWLDAIAKPFEAHLEKLADACASLLAVTGRSPHQDATSDRAPVVAALATEQPQRPIRGNVSTSAPAEIPPAGRQPSMVLWWRHKSPRTQRQVVLTVVTVVILGTAGTITGYLLRPDSHASHTTTAQPAPAAGQTAQPAPAPGPTATTTTSPSAAAAVPELAPFVGRWRSHTGILVIRQIGSGHLAYTDFTTCPSCSSADAPTSTVDFTLTSVSNDVATGIIEASSNEQNVTVGADVTAQLVAGSPSGQTVQISMGRLHGAF